MENSNLNTSNLSVSPNTRVSNFTNIAINQISVTYNCQRCNSQFTVKSDSSGNAAIPKLSTKKGKENAVFSEILEQQNKITTLLTKASETTFDLENANSFQQSIPWQVCTDCYQIVLRQLDEEIERFDKANSKLQIYSIELEKQKENQESSLEQEIEVLLKQKTELEKEYKEMKKEEEELYKQIQLLKEEEQDIIESKTKYFSDFKDFQYEEQVHMEEFQTYTHLVRYTKAEHDKLLQSNVYQDTFFISAEEEVPIGSINNFRFGRLPEIKVEWEEINTAFGEVLLLMYIIAKKIDITFTKYDLCPLGSKSTIFDKEKESHLHLYGSSNVVFRSSSWLEFSSFWGIGSSSPNSSFDTALKAFFLCLKDLCNKASKIFNIRLGYSIEGERIGDRLIKTESNTEQSWTEALKFSLFNLNQILAQINKKTDH